MNSGRGHEAVSRTQAAAFAFVFAAIVFVSVLWAPVALRDPDTLWHITTGDWILRHGAVPTVDTFSFTMIGHPWFAQEWLSEVLLAIAYQWSRWNGVLILTSVAAGSAVGLVAFYLRLRLRANVAVMLVLLAAACGGPSLLSRPHLLVLPLMTLWAIGLIAARARDSGPPLILLPLMTVWANLHGGFLIGLVLAGALGVEAVFEAGERWRASLLHWGGFLLAAFGAAAITPHGIDGLLFPFRLMSMRNLYQIMEWKPSDFSHLDGMTVWILVALYLGLTGTVRLAKFRVVLLTGLLFATMQHVRNAQLFGVLAPLLVADSLGRGSNAPRPSTLSVPSWVPFSLASAAMAVSLTLRHVMPLERSNDSTYAMTALASVPADLRDKPVFNDYAFGGMLIFDGVRPFIDGRADLYGDAFIDTYLSIVLLKKDRLDDVLCRYGIEWTVFPPETVVPALLDRTRGWRRLYSDHFAVIHVRDQQVIRPDCPARTEPSL